MTKEESSYAYAFMQWCDGMSLILCMKQNRPEERRLEVGMGLDGVSYYLMQRKDKLVTFRTHHL